MTRPRGRFLGGLLLTGALLAALSTSTFAHAPARPTGVTPEARARTEKLTLELVRLSKTHRLAAPGGDASVEADMLVTAQARERELEGLVETDPAEVLRLAVPVSLRAGLPARVKHHVEEETDVEGTIEVLHEDSAAGSRYVYTLDTALGRLGLHFAGEGPDDVQSGTRVRVKGVRVGRTLAAGGASTGSVQTVAAIAPNTFGAQSTLVILVNFTDRATQPYAPAYAQSVVFTTTSGFVQENSYGRTWLTGDVTGWFTIPMSYTVCNYSQLATYAKQAAAAAGFNPANYARHVIAFPDNACGWWGLGTVGGYPSTAWINGTFVLNVVGHEMGHNLGLWHSHSLDCGAVVLGGGCTMTEYGDTLDIMGSAGTGHYNAFQKERLGWLNYAGSPGLVTATTSATYTIGAYESAAATVKGIKVAQSINPTTGATTSYYLEYRQGLGFDGFIGSNGNVKNGVVVHLGTENSGDSSYLLDMTPATSSWSDPAVGLGQTYADTAAGVSITPVWADGTSAGISVVVGSNGCVAADPTVAMSPAQAQWRAPGGTATFSVALTNNDTAGCAPATFALQRAVPGGWTGILGTTSVQLNPGATSTTSLDVTSPASATDGYYTISAAATRGTSAGVSATGTYVVSTPPGTPVSVSTDRPSYLRGATVSITVKVGGGTPVNRASVTVRVTKPAGSAMSQTVTTKSNGVASAKFSLRRNDPVGTYQVSATYSSKGSVAGQASTSFVAQ